MTLREIRFHAGEACTLYFDEVEPLRATQSVVSELSLHAPEILSESEFVLLQSECALATAKVKAVELLGLRAMSKGELCEKLREKGWDETASAAAAERMEELGILDDRDYAGMIVRHYAAKGCGASRIKAEFYKRRVPREYWEEALEALPEQDETLDRLLASRLQGTACDRAAIKKATDYLRRRGFGWNEISAALSRMAEKE